MTDDVEKRTRTGLGRGMALSILLHAVFAAVLFLHLPVDFPEPEREESVAVEIVPPPEKPAEEQAAAEAEAEEQEEKPAEQPLQPPPEPPAQEAEAAEPPSSPPPPEPPGENQPEEPAADDEAAPRPVPVLRPVVEFGDEDSGPRRAEAGSASEEGGPRQPATPAAAEPPQEQTSGENQQSVPLPDNIDVPEVDTATVIPQQQQEGQGEALTPSETNADIVPPPPAAEQGDVTQETMPSPTRAELPEAKTLYSRNETDDPVARTAMRNIPREVRAGQLCATEMQAQLSHASPPYRPDIVQVYRLPEGTVLEVNSGAFRADARWYDLRFRCEVNEDATRVLSFAFDVGPPVPRSEWRRRGFPD